MLLTAPPYYFMCMACRVLSCGGMRFQAPKVPANTMEFCPANAEHFVPAEAQANVEEIVKASMAKGINHFETAKYGCR